MQRRQCTSFVPDWSTEIWIKNRTFWDREGNARVPAEASASGSSLSSYCPLLSLSFPLRVDETRMSASQGTGRPRPVPVPRRRVPPARRVRETGRDAEWPWTLGGTRPISRRDWRCRSLQRKIQLMNMRSTRAYPNISDILARKAEGRRELASQ